MQESILSKLEASRKELLDLGLRNPLINYKPLSGKGLFIVNERSSNLYHLLVNEGKAMSFVAKADTEQMQAGLGEEEGAAKSTTYSDAKLQTPETETSLQVFAVLHRYR